LFSLNFNFGDVIFLQISSLRSQNQQLNLSGGNSGSQSNQALQARCDTLVKDRDAVQTILEHKIKVLVQSVAQAAFAVISSSPQGASAIGQSLSQVMCFYLFRHCILSSFLQDVQALQKLVNASIAALRNAANATNNSVSVSPVPSAASISTPQPTGYTAANGVGNNRPPQYTPSTASSYDPSRYGSGTQSGAHQPTSSSFSTPSGQPNPLHVSRSVDGLYDAHNHANSSTNNNRPVSVTGFRSAPPLPSPARLAPEVPTGPSYGSSSYATSGGISSGGARPPMSASSFLSSTGGGASLSQSRPLTPGSTTSDYQQQAYRAPLSGGGVSTYGSGVGSGGYQSSSSFASAGAGVDGYSRR
jgi:hypothetical protein